MTWPDPITIAAIAAGVVAVIREIRGVKAQGQVAAEKATIAADKAETADIKLDQIHDKADIAIAQNEKLDKQTDGNFSKMQQQLTAAETYNKALQEQIVSLTAMLTAKQMATDVTAGKPGGRRIDDATKSMGPIK